MRLCCVIGVVRGVGIVHGGPRRWMVRSERGFVLAELASTFRRGCAEVSIFKQDVGA